MTYARLLEVAAHWSAILTGFIALVAGCKYWLDRRAKRHRLEHYLKHVKENGTDKGQRTVLHLTARLAMTENDILQSAFASRQITSRVGIDPETKRANTLFLEYV